MGTSWLTVVGSLLTSSASKPAGLVRSAAATLPSLLLVCRLLLRFALSVLRLSTFSSLCTCVRRVRHVHAHTHTHVWQGLYVIIGESGGDDDGARDALFELGEIVVDHLAHGLDAGGQTRPQNQQHKLNARTQSHARTHARTTPFLFGYLGEVQERGEEVEVEEKQKLDGLTHRREQRDHAGLFFFFFLIEFQIK